MTDGWCSRSRMGVCVSQSAMRDICASHPSRLGIERCGRPGDPMNGFANLDNRV